MGWIAIVIYLGAPPTFVHTTTERVCERILTTVSMQHDPKLLATYCIENK